MKNTIRAVCSSFLLLSVLSTGALAASNTPKITFPTVEDAGFDASALQAALTRVKAARKLAAADTDRTYSQSDLDPVFVTFRDKFLKITTADQLDAFLAETDAGYDSYPNELKYFVAQAQLIRPFRSIVYRLRPIFEHDKSIQSSAVTILRSLASSLMIYLPTSQWEAGFAYVSIPSADHDDTNIQFHQISDFQDFLMSVAPNIAKAGHRVAAIYKLHSPDALIWDNQLLYGLGGFQDGLDRYRVHGDAELAAFLSGIHGSLQAIAAFCAYNQDDLLDVGQDLGHLAGMNGFTFLEKIEGQDIGVSAKDRMKIFAKPKYKKFMTLKGANATANSKESGAELMAKSFKQMAKSVEYAEAAWNVLQGSKASNYEFFNPLLFQGANEREGTARFKNIDAMLATKTTLRSVVTGETASIDLPNFFLKNPPQDLKAFLPRVFDESEETLKLKTTSGETLSYHNYFRGRAIGWDTATWSVITDVSSPEQVATSIRVLKQSWGGDYISPVLDFIAQ